MDLFSLLVVFVEVSVAFTGFAGIVAVLANPKEWAAGDTIRFQQLISISASIFFLSILPMGLSIVFGDILEDSLWRICSFVFFVTGIGTALYRHKQAAGGTPGWIVATAIVHWLLLCVGMATNTVWGYLFGLILYFVILFVNFGSLVIKWAQQGDDA